MRKIEYIILHVAASYEDKDYTFDQLKKDHALKGINEPGGYHFYIRKDGTIHKGRDLEVIGAHAKPWNHNSIGICFEGGLRSGGNVNNHNDWIDSRTEKQKVSVLDLIRVLLDKLKDAPGQDVSKLKIIGHYQVPGVTKPCPNFNVPSEYGWITL